MCTENSPPEHPGEHPGASWGGLFPRALQEKSNYIKNTFNCCYSIWLKEGGEKPWFMRQSPGSEMMIQAAKGSGFYTDWVTWLPQREKDGCLISPTRTAVHWRLMKLKSCQVALRSLSGQGQQHLHHSRHGLKKGQNPVLPYSFALQFCPLRETPPGIIILHI